MTPEIDETLTMATVALDEVRQRLPAVDEDAAHVGGHQPVPLVVRRVDDRA